MRGCGCGRDLGCGRGALLGWVRGCDFGWLFGCDLGCERAPDVERFELDRLGLALRLLLFGEGAACLRLEPLEDDRFGWEEFDEAADFFAGAWVSAADSR